MGDRGARRKTAASDSNKRRVIDAISASGN
jgi:hypothetical protein